MVKTLLGFDGSGWEDTPLTNTIKINAGSFSLRKESRPHKRNKIGAFELRKRVALGKELQSVRHLYGRTEWTRFLEKNDIKPGLAQACMRIAKRFGEAPRLDQISELKIPFNVIDALSSEFVTDGLVDEFLKQIAEVLPTTENCQKVLDNIRESMRESEAAAISQAIVEAEALEEYQDSFDDTETEHQAIPENLRDLLQAMVNFHMMQERAYKDFCDNLTNMLISIKAS